MGFTKATKRRAKLRLALCGPTGSGKTYSALAIAQGLGQRIALIDTECGSASLYADKFAFDVLELESGHPEGYIEAIHEAEKSGYDVVIIDSLSHAWMGNDGALELVDKAAKRSRSGNNFNAWREVTPLHNKLVNAIVRCKCHVIATMRSKMAYEIQENARGKKAPVKLGMAPVQRDGMGYEFTLVADLDVSNTLLVSKTRCSDLAQAVIDKPGRALGEQLKAWLEDGAPAPEPKAEQPKKRAPVRRSSSPRPTKLGDLKQPSADPHAETVDLPVPAPALNRGQAEEAQSVRDRLNAVRATLGEARYLELVPVPPKNLLAAKRALERVKGEESKMAEAAIGEVERAELLAEIKALRQRVGVEVYAEIAGTAGWPPSEKDAEAVRAALRLHVREMDAPPVEVPEPTNEEDAEIDAKADREMSEGEAVPA